MRGDAAQPIYALYHRGFADYVRRQLPQGGRGWDVRAAQALDRAGDDDSLLRDYSANFRWSHLLRGLDLTAATDKSDQRLAIGDSDGATLQSPISNLQSLSSIAQVQAQVRDPVAQAQLLRGLAARALDPAQSRVNGSWAAALSSLRAAEHTLHHSRALVYNRRRGWRISAGEPISNELIELERTLVALGDAYRTIASRMDDGSQRPTRPDPLCPGLSLRPGGGP